jgi:TetR/AcrR family tetracycline transcriptional repressor
LTREAVLGAAARVLEREGYGGLTMRAIANELRVQAPALYWYVASKEALKVLLYDHLMSGFSVTLSGGDWRENTRNAARQLRQHMRGKRDISKIAPHDFSVGPNSLAQLDGGLGILLAAGLSARDAAYAFNLIYNYVLGWVAGEADSRAFQAAGEDHREAEHLAAIDAAAFPNVAALGAHLASNDPDGRFEFGLECIIAGLERRIAPGA